MCDNLGLFVSNGNIFMALFGADVGVKLAEEDRKQLLAKLGAKLFGPPERPMSGYVTLPADWSAEEAEPWVATALATAAALPPKQPEALSQVVAAERPGSRTYRRAATRCAATPPPQRSGPR